MSAGPCVNFFPQPLGQLEAHEGAALALVGSVEGSALTSCLCTLPSGSLTVEYFFVTALPKNRPNVGWCELGFFCWGAGGSTGAPT